MAADRDIMSLIDVLLAEQINEIFVDALLNRQGVDLTFLYGDAHDLEPAEVQAYPAVRIRTPAGQSLVVTPRRIAREVGAASRQIAAYEDLTGYDWIAPELADKIELKAEHYDRLYLYLRDGSTRVVESLGPAVYPLMTFLGKVLELRSEKVLLRSMDPEVVDVLGRCLKAAVHGPFLDDDAFRTQIERDRGSIAVLAHMWPGLNLASPELARTLSAAVTCLLPHEDGDAVVWTEWIGASGAQLRGALEVFRSVVSAGGVDGGATISTA